MRTFQPSVYSFAGDFGTTIPPVPGTAVSPVPEGAVSPKKGGKKKKRRPLWVLPTIVGSSILVVGGLATFLVYRSKKKKASAAVPAPAAV